ncbi:MAG: LuxR C-terminal-related transcriptional regulator [Acidimicrobiales bacterium]
MGESWPLVGRERELAEVLDALEVPGAAVLLFGDLGCGKTRLAGEVFERLALAGRTTAHATATEAQSAAPLGAIAHLVPRSAADPDATVLQAIHEAVASRGTDDPLYLHLDDAHHLDVSSATLLVGLVSSGAMRLLATARRGMVLPEPFTALRGMPEARSFELGPLDRAAADDLLVAALDAPVDGQARDQLWRLSEGNPLYLRELVLGGMADGWFAQVSGVWQLRGAPSANLSLGERVMGRLRSLGPEAHAAIELLAVGEPIGLDVLVGLTSDEAVDELERAGVAVVEVDRRRHDVRVAHPLYGEVLRSSMDEDSRRHHAAQLVGAIGALGARRATDPQRIAQWQLSAGLDADPEALLASARIARHHNDWVTAVRLARAALDAGLPDAAYLCAEAHYALGEFEDGDAVAAAAFADVDRLSHEALAGLHRTRGGVWFFGTSSTEEAFAAVEVARSVIDEPDLLDMLGYAEAIMCMWSGRVREARAIAEPLLDAPDVKVRVQAALAAENVAAAAGPVTRAVELAEAAYPVHAALPDLNGTNSPAFHLLIQAEAMVNAGWFDRAEGLARFGYDLALASLNRIAQMWFARELGRIALYRGDAASSRAWFQEAVALCRGTSWFRPMALELSELAMAEAHLGDAEAAAAAIEARDRLGVPVIPIFASEAVRGAAWAQAVNGDRDGAREALVAAADAADEAGIALFAALARIDALRLGARDQAAPLAAAAAVVASDLVSVGARWAAAVDAGDALELESVGGAFEALGCTVLGAEALEAAAAAWRAAGDEQRAAAASGRAATLAATHQAAPAPVPERDAAPDAMVLTPRELEIAELAASGLTAKAVAEQLRISHRTVSNHLQNAYTKLGVSGRAELAPVLDRLRSARAV